MFDILLIRQFRSSFFSHGFSFKLNSVSVVNQAVQDGIGNRGIPDMIVPIFNRELTGNQGGT